MYLKFNFNNNGSTFGSGLVTVNVDDGGNIEFVSCTNSSIETMLGMSENLSKFQSFVKDSVNGKICSDQFELKAGARSIDYKVEQLP
ncbi:MAG: hypothetical protein WCG25_02675 [bacterium]